MLASLLSTVGLSLGIGSLLIVLRYVLRLRKRLVVDLALTAAGGAMLVLLHLTSHDLFGLDPWYGIEFELAKHGLELIVILMLLVAF